MKYIRNRYFSNSFTIEEQLDIIDKYSDSCWDYAKQFLSESKPITKSAVQIADLIEHKLGIQLFPLIKTIASKGWDLSGGTCAFMMFGENGKAYSFDERSHRYKSNRANYYEAGGIIYRE